MSDKREVRVRLAHRVEYESPLEVAAGDRVIIGREDDEFPGWRWCQATDGREGWVPIELLSGQGLDANVLQNYSAQELAVEPGDVVVVEDARHGWVLVRNREGSRGWIPASNVEGPEA